MKKISFSHIKAMCDHNFADDFLSQSMSLFCQNLLVHGKRPFYVDTSSRAELVA